MRLDLDDHDQEPQINLTPMLDMVFNLLLFFLAATTFARDEVDLDLKLPQARSGASQEGKQQFVVNVLADGRLSVDGREITLEALRQKLAALAQRNREQPVLVRGDHRAQFGVGVQVLDACRLAKLAKVDFAAIPVEGR